VAFQRILGYQPVGGDVPPAGVSEFTPATAAVYGEAQFRLDDLAFTAGLRYDQFDPGTDVAGSAVRRGGRGAINPRLAVSTVLKGAIFVASWGHFSQAPDYQYLVDAAFDDTARTGRFRRGNPNLGHESAMQYEFSVRTRPTPNLALRVNVYIKRLDGLVGSVPLGIDPDSTVFGNADFGSVKGAELLVEREWSHNWGIRVIYSLQQATATASNAFQLFRRIRLDPVGDTIFPASVEYPLDYDRRHGLITVLRGRIPQGWGPSLGAANLLGGLEAAAVFRYSSGLPYSRTNATGDTLIGLPNSARLPAQQTLDLRVRRPFRLRGVMGSLYFDARNALNRQNIEAVRRETGQPGVGETELQAAARAAYQARPYAIPFESPRYREWADLDGNGRIEGQAELLPLYDRAARDFYQPLFSYGTPRLVRIGLDLTF
jgi:outer membrane receptor protein involved in Fe transport